MISPSVQSAELAKVGAFLEVMDPLTTFKLRGDTTKLNYVAVRGTKFKIVYIKEDTCYVEFEKVIKKATNSVAQDRRYYILKSEINEGTCRFTRGLYAAALTVPLKYRFKLRNAPSALSTNFDISSALGYSFGVIGVTVTPVGFIGLATISLTDTNSVEVETHLGITYGGGVAVAFSPNFQLAFIGGADLLTGSIAERWPYQNKIWVSIGIGYKFLDL